MENKLKTINSLRIIKTTINNLEAMGTGIRNYFKT